MLSERKEKHVMFCYGFIRKIQIDYILSWFRIQLILHLWDRECLPDLLTDISTFLETNLLFTSLNLMIMMMNCFCGMVNQRKVLSLKSSRHHCQRFSLSQISDTLRAGFESVHSRSSGFVEWRCTVIINTYHCTT